MWLKTRARAARRTGGRGEPLTRFGEVDFRWPGKAAVADVVGVGRDRAADVAPQVCVAAHELRRPVEEAKHVVGDQDLAVAARGGPDANGRHVDSFGDFPR